MILKCSIIYRACRFMHLVKLLIVLARQYLTRIYRICLVYRERTNMIIFCIA